MWNDYHDFCEFHHYIQKIFTRHQLGKRDTVALSNISSALVSDTVTRNLGLLLDQELSMADHITKLSQVCFFHLRCIRVVRHSLTRSALLTLVHALYSRRASFIDSQCTAHSRARIRMLSTRLLQQCDVRDILVPARSSAVDFERRCSTHPPNPEVLLHLVGDPGWACTGFLSAHGSSSSSAFSSVAAWPVQLHPISPSSVSRFPPLLVVVKIYARLPRVPLWYQGSGQNDTVDGVSPFPGPHLWNSFTAKNSFSRREARFL